MIGKVGRLVFCNGNLYTTFIYLENWEEFLFVVLSDMGGNCEPWDLRSFFFFFF